MLRYIVRRLLLTLPVLFGISLIAFIIIYLAPGDFLDRFRLIGMPAEQIEALESKFGLDQPFIVQYGRWLKQVVSGSLGVSWGFGQPVTEIIWSRVVFTLVMGLTSLIISWGIAIPMGIYVAKHQYSFRSQSFSFLSFLGMSLPEFFLAYVWYYITSLTLLLPSTGVKSPTYIYMNFSEKVVDRALHLIPPIFILVIPRIGPIMRMMRGQFLEGLNKDYVHFARAKGLPEKIVIRKHVLRNAINPIITNFGFAFSAILSGSIFVEVIFNLPGLGSLAYNSFRMQDVFLSMGTVLLSGVMILIGNLIADFMLAYNDPRVRFNL
ncbi:MAG: ABC transporter permease [Kosmotoga sp.]|nr:MAG: ABC transporter permease [Kosmotoga sp.]